MKWSRWLVALGLAAWCPLAAPRVLAMSPGPGAPAPAMLRVRASEILAPCVQAAIQADPAGGRVTLDRGGPLEAGTPADVVVASAVEITRALESGAAELGTDRDVARVPWVLSVAAGSAAAARKLDFDGVRHSTLEVWLPAGPAAYEARRALEGASCRVREGSGAVLRGASVALVPLSLAGAGDRIAVKVPPVIARAALTATTPRAADATRWLDFLTSPAGLRAFAACTPAQ